MLGKWQIANQKPTAYATGADFCRIFNEDMARLYLLSFLLTGDHQTAEKCFVRGLESSRKSNSVFKEWARSWARRAIVQNAIRILRPSPVSTPVTSGADRNGVVLDLPEEIAAIVELPAFERFVFVMSVLEGYSDRECSLLLECARTDVIVARTRALQQIGGSPEFHRERVAIESDQRHLTIGARPAFSAGVTSPLAASA